MPRLRPTRTLARIVLAWFVFCVALASAAPAVQPLQLQEVCSASGAITLLDAGPAGTPSLLQHGLDCPFCLPSGAPPPHPVGVTSRPLLQAAQAPRPPQSGARRAVAAAAPMPARGPPPFV